jgi:hypothetical protein
MAQHDDPLERLLQAEPLDVPQGFSERVMQRITYLPLPAQGSQPLEWLQWLALSGGALAGIGQVLSFVFGIWMVSAAG